jgi:transcriptional regulator with XRE-family HTH domain
MREKDKPDPIGDRIARARRKLGITQHNAATRLGFPSQQWWAYEHGRTVPGPARMVAIARLLGVSVEYLATGVRR